MKEVIFLQKKIFSGREQKNRQKVWFGKEFDVLLQRFSEHMLRKQRTWWL